MHFNFKIKQNKNFKNRLRFFALGMWRAPKAVRTGTSAAINFLRGRSWVKRSAVKHGSEADPGTSPTAWGGLWVGKAGMPK